MMAGADADCLEILSISISQCLSDENAVDTNIETDRHIRLRLVLCPSAHQHRCCFIKEPAKFSRLPLRCPRRRDARFRPAAKAVPGADRYPQATHSVGLVAAH